MAHTTHGGQRDGAGRKRGNRSVAVTFRISPDSAAILSKIKNKSEYIDELIKKAGK